MAPLMVVFTVGVAAQDVPPLSPSIEHDADYLLTTTDFAEPQFGMAVEGVRQDGGRLTVRTTGAEFAFEPAADRLRLRQRLGRAREAAVVTFAEGALDGLRVDRRSGGAVLISAREGRLQLRVNGDSLLMLRDADGLKVRYELAFSPITVRQFSGSFLLLDEYGGIGSYPATGPEAGCALDEDGTVTCDLQPGQILWLSVAPPRDYPWEASRRDRVCWHWSMQTGYPPDADIERWSPYGNILLQQSEVMLWKDWSLRFIPRNGIEEFRRVNEACERLGMRNIVYTSPFYFLTGTGLEDRAMNSFDNFAVTGFSPGDGRGLNWPIFLHEITKVMQEYRPDGLYFDGIYGNVVRTYLISRKAREVVGDDGLLEFHATGSPPGGGAYLPQIDTYFDFILRGEGCQAEYTNPDYLRYFVSTHNISNSVGVLCNNNDYPLDEAFINTLLDNNIRLHYLLGGPDDPRTQGMTRYYWPALTPALKDRVAKACESRQASTPRMWEALQRARRAGTADLRLLYESRLTDPGLRATLDPRQADDIPLSDSWRAWFSPHSEGAMAPTTDGLKITAHAHTVAYLERNLPEDAVAAECRVRAAGDCGMSWGPGLLVRVGTRTFRVGLRSDDRAQVDRAGSQLLYDGFLQGEWVWLRVRFVEGCVLFETSGDSRQWRCLQADFIGPTSGPKSLAIGKIPYNGGRDEYTEPGGFGTCELTDVRVFGQG